jgi:hypothetical protein
MKKNLLLIIATLFTAMFAKAQLPSFEWRLENGTLTSPTTYTVDVYLYNTSASSFELRGGTIAFLTNSAWRNGGTITTAKLASELVVGQQSSAVTAYVTTAPEYWRQTITSLGAGSGTTIAAGTRVLIFKMQLSNTVAYSTTASPNFAWKFNAAPSAGWNYTNGIGNSESVVSNTANTINQLNCHTPTYWNGSAWISKSVRNGADTAVIPSSSKDAEIYTGTLPTGNLTCRSYRLNAGAIHNLGANTLNVGYNLANNGTLNASSGSINLAGTTATQTTKQTISGISSVSTNNLSLVAGTSASLSTSVNVNSNLTLTTGRISINNNNLTLGNSATISGASSTAYIVTDSAGSLVLNNVGTGGKTGAVLFPIGTSTSYNPISITNDSIADNYWVSVKQGVDAAGALLTTNAVDKKWSIKEAISGGSKLTVNLQWNSADELPSFARALSYVSMVDSTGRWIPSSAAAANGSGPYSQTLSGVTELSNFGAFGVGSNNALPISLLSFGGIKKANSVLLNWRTAAEINSKEFQIERLDLNNKFVKIGTVKASGNSNRVLVYNFTDFDILANQKVNFYRLKMVDLDGSFKYSNIIKISDENGPKLFTVFPNPSVGKLNIESNNINLAASTYKITNIIGETVKTGNSAIEEIDVNNLAAGVYMITLVDSTNESVSVKFVKQ